MAWTKEEMCAIAALLELKDGIFVNLGIGIPTSVPNYIPKNIKVTFQSENGMLGIGPFPFKGEEDPDLINVALNGKGQTLLQILFTRNSDKTIFRELFEQYP